MRTILVLGAGRSAKALITYLLERSDRYDWSVVVGDKIVTNAQAQVAGHARGSAIYFDLDESDAIATVIASVDVVISLLPPEMHNRVAEHCLYHKKHLMTASYLTGGMKALHDAAKSNNLLFLNECGLDPGIDHMSAMEIIDGIKKKGGQIRSFESFAGGLIAPGTDPDNPWRYKFTWNPRNVVTAGQHGAAEFLQHGIRCTVPYEELFKTVTPVFVPGLGDFEGYPNRDSLGYLDLYGLKDLTDMIRGTLRYKGFCSAWDILVNLGCCYENKPVIPCLSMTHLDFMNTFVKAGAGTLKERIALRFGLPTESHEIGCLTWSGLFDSVPIGLDAGTPAQILEHILMKKWKLGAGDKDMIVMFHRLTYEISGKTHQIQTSLTVEGEDSYFTAMAMTVGLPLGIAAKLLLENEISARGVVIPAKREFYEPILHELSTFGITFTAVNE